MVLACLLDPLRVVRDQMGADTRWRILTDDDLIVTRSNGLTVSPEMQARDTAVSDLVIIIGGDAFRDARRTGTSRTLERLMHNATVIAADTGAWVRAREGLPNSRKATLHWQL